MEETNRYNLAVLYVEDEADTRDEVGQLLMRRVAKLWLAENGGIGLEAFRQQAPDLVITDIRMPVLDGLEMARRIRQLSPETQIIVTTAYSDMAFMLAAIEIGVDQYVLKPIETGRLFAAIAKCAATVELRRAARKATEEREKLVEELQAALAKVKLLSGFLPICAACKNIRDDQGYWQRIEAYIHDHSEAVFTHGICPDCARKLYPEFSKCLKNKPEKP